MEAFGPRFLDSGAKGVYLSPFGARKAPFTGTIYFLHSRIQKRVNVPFWHWLLVNFHSK